MLKKWNSVVFILLILCIGACGMVALQKEQNTEEQAIVDLVNKLVSNTHYNKLPLDDTYSKKAYDALLKAYDSNKRFLVQSDLKILSKHELKIDDYFTNASMDFFDDLYPILTKNEKEVQIMVLDILKNPIVFKTLTDVQTNSDSIDFCKDKTELKERWKQNLAFMVNDRLFLLEKRQETDSTLKGINTAGLEIKAREYVLEKHQEWFKRMNKEERSDRFSIYVNALISIYCPHTQYFPPSEKEDFDIGFSGKLEGIGATLSEKDGYVKVEKIVAGSASWKGKQLEVGDIILEVAQGAEKPVDIFDMRLDKAVRLIRGPKGTEVRLTVKKVTGDTKIISIIRDVVIIEETYAKSILLKDVNDSEYYGYISLESFYADFNNKNGRKCSKDVLKEILALNKHNVKGIILDLRDNGGGSLMDAVEMAGYFIKTGPIVQVDGNEQAPEVYPDVDPRIQSDVPLVVLINGFSASASEIFAAAIQDYRRGIIIGTNSYGKGTVQRFYPLEQVAAAYNLAGMPAELGEVKETIAKFFRINGGATQLKGVKPDVVIPENYMFLDMSESSYDNALPWKAIKPAEYDTFAFPQNMAKIASIAQQRVDTNRYFLNVKKNAKQIKTMQDASVYPLNYANYKVLKLKNEEINKASEAEKQKIKDWTIHFHSEDKALIENDSIAGERLNKFKETVQEDHYIREALRILRQF